MTVPGRRTLLFGVLALTLAAAAWVAVQERPPQRQAKASAARSAMADPPRVRQGQAQRPVGELRLPMRLAESGPIVDPFAAPSPPTGSAQRGGRGQARPVAPPLPFVYLGRYVGGDGVQVFLGDGEQLYTVKAGDIIENKYRVDRIDDAVRMTYLPLKETQILVIGDM